MNLSVSQPTGNDRLIRTLFVLGLVGLIIAGSGIIWLLTGYFSLVNRAAMYSGSWSHSCYSCHVTSLTISRNGLNLTVVAYDNISGCSNCPYNASTVVFTGEPFMITTTYPYSALTIGLTISLNNPQGTQLKVVEDSITSIFMKNGT